jgi:hypothetical protein
MVLEKKRWISWVPAFIFLALTFRFGFPDSSFSVKSKSVGVSIVFYSSSTVRFKASFEHVPVCRDESGRGLHTERAYGGGYEITGLAGRTHYVIRCISATKNADFEVKTLADIEGKNKRNNLANL